MTRVFSMVVFSALGTMARGGQWSYCTSGTPITRVQGGPLAQTARSIDAWRANAMRERILHDAQGHIVGAIPPGQGYDDHRTFNPYLKGTDGDYTLSVSTAKAAGKRIEGSATVYFTLFWSPTLPGEKPPKSVSVEVQRHISLDASGKGRALVRDAAGKLMTQATGDDPNIQYRAEGIECLTPLRLTVPVKRDAQGRVTAVVPVQTDRVIASAEKGGAARATEITAIWIDSGDEAGTGQGKRG